jgi:ABC-type Zn uptake system ZnuABC Zn-binding protein ZnuA
MKSTVIIFIVFLGLLVAGCTNRNSKQETSTEHEDSSKPTKLVVSIPSVVLSKVFGDSLWFEKTTQAQCRNSRRNHRFLNVS